MTEFKITKSQNSRKGNVDWNNLRFGVYFSDHIFVSDYYNGKWQDMRIEPYGIMPMEPSLCTLHYGQSIFEGLKAFPDQKGGVNIFRPIMNAKRLNHSAQRLCIPDFDENILLEGIKQLVEIDKEWIPKGEGTSLYLRPVVYGSGNFLGVHASDTYRLIVMSSPVGSYYPEGLNPVKILVTSDYVRVVRGGLGSAKTAANYAASLLGGMKAKEQGFAQVLWLDGISREYIDEVGAMNIMFVIDDVLVTPPLDQGTILAGVTRDTVLSLAREWGMRVTERRISITEIIEAHRNGHLKEVFGTGTAAVISPVGLLKYKDYDMVINDGKIGDLSWKFYNTITGIQYGKIDDTHNWNLHLDIEI
jgi:branched-chain amino acid aminotransferase